MKVPPSPPSPPSEPPRVKVLYNYRGKSSRELPIRKGDVLVLVNDSNKDWWKVELNGKQGFVPANYIRKMEAPPSPRPTPPPPMTPPTSFIATATDDNREDSVGSRQAQLEVKYRQLQQLGRERQQRLAESQKKFELMREVNELEHWINDKVWLSPSAVLYSQHDVTLAHTLVYERLLCTSIVYHSHSYNIMTRVLCFLYT